MHLSDLCRLQRWERRRWKIDPACVRSDVAALLGFALQRSLRSIRRTERAGGNLQGDVSVNRENDPEKIILRRRNYTVLL